MNHRWLGGSPLDDLVREENEVFERAHDRWRQWQPEPRTEEKKPEKERRPGPFRQILNCLTGNKR